MPNFTVYDLNPEFWARVQARPTAEGTTVKAVILRLLAQWLGVVALLVSTACSPPAVTGPTPVTNRPPVNVAPVVRIALTGQVTAANGGQPLAGLTVTIGDVSGLTDAGGAYRLDVLPSARTVTVTGQGIVPRETPITPSPQRVTVFGPGFDLPFYTAFARNGWEQPAALQPIRHWTQAPQIYLRTIDEAGLPIDAVTLNTAAAAIENTAGIWSGHTFGVAGVTRGPETREGVAGWLTVKWPNPPELENCGRGQVGIEGGWIALNYLYVPIAGVSGSCGCGGSRIRPRTVRHELGHAFGFYHTGQAADLMSGLSVADCDHLPSDREQEYARYVYGRPVGNVAPDTDPSSTVLALAVHRFVD